MNVRCVALLRGINLGARNRIAMPVLRTALLDAGFTHVRTYLQSGNVVIDTERLPEDLSVELRALLEAQFGLSVPVVVRAAAELSAVLARNPLGAVATDPKRYQVTFCEQVPDEEVLGRLKAAVTAPEELVADGRELYAWHPHGIARSKLWNALAGQGLGVVATSRNWSTVTALEALARDD